MSIPPRLGAPAPLRLPAPARFTLSSGLRVLLIERPGLPLVNLELVALGGARAQGTVAGTAAFALDMLDEGAGGKTALEISGAVERAGALLSMGVDHDSASLRMNLLRPQLPEGIALFAAMATDPTFAPEEVERVREERGTRRLLDRNEPAVLASESFARTLFGSDHPYGVPLGGTGTTIRAIERDAMVAYHRATFAGENAVLLVAGAIGAEELRAILEEPFAHWPEESGVSLADPPTDPPRAGVTVVHRRGAQQSELRIGRVGARRGDPDEVVLSVLNTLLGGAFTSRLNMKLREERGFTYGAGSAFHFRALPGPFVAGSAVHTPDTAQAVEDVLAEIERLGREPVSADELDRARNWLILRLPQRFEGLDDLTARMAESVVHGFPADHWTTLAERIREVTAEAILDAAARWLPRETLQITVAGDREVIEAPLAALGHGTIRVEIPEEKE